ncbi:MAG: hypothetical protein H6508_08325 [Calditrichaeota bacterium]|nr:hypothetical protein [Calditrichota bacterium]
MDMVGVCHGHPQRIIRPRQDSDHSNVAKAITFAFIMVTACIRRRMFVAVLASMSRRADQRRNDNQHAPKGKTKE